MKPLIDRFFEKVEFGKPSECWLWTGARVSGKWGGYGEFKFAGKTRRAHRVSWMLNHGPIPKGRLICHHCDNPPCVNPTHLFSGTTHDNEADMLKKKRNPQTIQDEFSSIPKKEMRWRLRHREKYLQIHLNYYYSKGKAKRQKLRERGDL